MHLSPHLTFAGDCERAFRFYERSLGGKIATLKTYGDSAMAAQVPSDWHGKIVHGTLKVGRGTLAGADVLPDQYRRPQGFYVLLDVQDPAKADLVFRALAEKGDVRFALQKTFWSPAYGVLVDQFGIPWEVSCAPAPRGASSPRRRKHPRKGPAKKR